MSANCFEVERVGLTHVRFVIFFQSKLLGQLTGLVRRLLRRVVQWLRGVDQLVDPSQPLDYAPKKTPDEAGQLSEEFGLEKDYKPNMG